MAEPRPQPAAATTNNTNNTFSLGGLVESVMSVSGAYSAGKALDTKKATVEASKKAQTDKWNGMTTEQKQQDLDWKQRCREHKLVEERRQRWEKDLVEWSHIRCSPIRPRSDRQRLETKMSARIPLDFAALNAPRVHQRLKKLFIESPRQCGTSSQFDMINDFLASDL